jgi:hypothetical protein
MSKQDPQKRYFGLDVHKAYIMVAAVNADKQVVLKPQRVSLSHFEHWIDKTLQPNDEVVLEATTNAWYVHDLLVDQGGRVIVAHPYHIKLIAAAAVKTDKRDALTLARLLAANMIPPVYNTSATCAPSSPIATASSPNAPLPKTACTAPPIATTSTRPTAFPSPPTTRPGGSPSPCPAVKNSASNRIWPSSTISPHSSPKPKMNSPPSIPPLGSPDAFPAADHARRPRLSHDHPGRHH